MPTSIHSLNADLHCHTTASDGDLTPSALVERAVEQGVDLLAITDHDTTDGLEEAMVAAEGRIRLVSGIEFSSVWQGINIHILGLDFNPLIICDSVARQKQARQTRALKIARRLEKQGVNNALAGAMRYATSDVIGRPQFAKHLVAEGFVDSEAEAFKKWLGAGKLGDVKTSWLDIKTIVADIRNAGGCAVLAHPHHYKLTNRKLGKLLTEFGLVGGEGLEVCASGIRPEKTRYFASLCEKYNLMASRGSDFHTPENRWVELGRIAPLPESVTPIWSLFTAESVG